MLAATVLGLSLLTTPSPAPDPLAAEVAAYVADLSADGFRTRRAARASLAALGHDAAPHLAAARAAAGDAETRAALDGLLADLGAAGETDATLVSLNLDGVEPAEALAAVAAAVGTDVTTEPADLLTRLHFAPVERRWRGEPAWRVVTDLADGWGLYVRVDRDGYTLTDRPHHALAPDHGHIAGGYLTQLYSVRRDRVVKFSTAATQAKQEFSVTLRMYPEPRLRRAARNVEAVIDACVDDRGNELSVVEAGVNDLTGPGWTVRVKLDEPDRGQLGDEIVTLRGRVLRDLLCGFETVEASTDGPASFAVKGMQIEVAAAVEDDRGRREIDATLTQARTGDDPFATVDLLGDVVLTDAAGERYRLKAARKLQSRRESEVVTTATFAVPAAAELPGTLSWSLPTARAAVEVPFEFSGVPIP